MRTLFLMLLAFEVFSTLASGATAIAAPLALLPNLTAAAPGAAAPELTRLLGVAWIVIALVLAGVPFLRDARTMRGILLAIMVGDVLHTSVLLAAEDVHPAHFILSGLFFAYRAASLWRPQWLIRV